MIENALRSLPTDSLQEYEIHPRIGLSSSSQIEQGVHSVEFQVDDSQLWEIDSTELHQKALVKMALHSSDVSVESAWQHPLMNEMLFLDQFRESDLQAFAKREFGMKHALFPRVLRTFFHRPLVQVESKSLYPQFILETPNSEFGISRTCFGYIQETRGDRLTHAFGQRSDGWHAVWDGVQKSAITLAYLEYIGVMHADVKAKQIIQSDRRETTTLVDFEHAQAYNGMTFSPLVSLFEEPYCFSAINHETASPEQIADFSIRIDANPDFEDEFIVGIADTLQRAFHQYQRFGLPVTPQDFERVELGASNKTDVFQFGMTILSIVENQGLTLRRNIREMFTPFVELRSSDRPTMMEAANLVTSLDAGSVIVR